MHLPILGGLMLRPLLQEGSARAEMEVRDMENSGIQNPEGSLRQAVGT